MAKRRPSSSKKAPTSRGSEEDAFTARILEFLAWARHRTGLLVGAGIIGVVLVVGGLLWWNQRSARLDMAAAELEMVQQWVMFTEPQAAQAEVREYIERFAGTPYALEARLLLAELHLDENQANEAISVLQAVAPAYRSPLQVQATFLLAVAFEEAERWDDAVSLYRELRDRAEYSFQEREAGEGLARTLLARGDREAAIDAYREVLALLEPGDPRRARYEMRIAELSAAGP